MRRILALTCCAVYAAFGLVAGFAHVHESADHHDQVRGLHVGHGHLGDGLGRDHHHAHHHDHERHDKRPDTVPMFGSRHVDHHADDAVYLNATPARSTGAAVRLVPIVVSVQHAVAPPSTGRSRIDQAEVQPRDPPRASPPRMRAPPA